MRIAILTFHRAYNCGAMLQAWALKTVLERMGHKVAFPFGDYFNVLPKFPIKSPLSDRCRTGPFFRRIRSFVYRLILAMCGKKSGISAGRYYEAFQRAQLPELICSEAEFKKHFDIIVLGSDQVLNPNIRGWTPYFLCQNVPSEIKKIAYSASIGENPLSMESKYQIINALTSFSAVSVREPFQNFPVTADPTLLLKQEDYNVLVKPFRRRREYLYMYSIETTPFEIDIARRIAAYLGIDLLITPLWGMYHRKPCREMSDKISPSYLVSYIRGAKYVLAGSFHGVAVALLHRKPFLNILPDQRKAKRVSTLLERIGESSRIVNPTITLDEMIARLVRPLDEKCYMQLERYRKESLEWLQKAINHKD